MKELESFRGHRKDVTTLAWHPFHEEYFVSGSYDGSIFHWLVGQDTPQIEISNAHDNNVWDLAWHPIGYLLCSGSSDHTTKFWSRNRPGDSARDSRYNNGIQGYAEQNPVAGRVPGHFVMPEGPTTPGPFPPGLMTRNEGTIPGVGVAMPLSIPSFDGSQGEQKQPHPGSLGAPPLPPGPHPSLLNPNQQQPFQQNPQQIPQHQQQLQQHMGPLPMPPNMPQIQHSSHSSMVPHQHLPRPPPQMPHGMPGSLPVPTSHPMPIPGPMGMQGTMNQMGPPMPQGHYGGMNQMHSGSLSSSGGPPMGGFPNNMQGPPNNNYPQGAPFNRPQGGQMPMMQGYNPYQSGNQPGMPPNAQQGGPHSQMPQ